MRLEAITATCVLTDCNMFKKITSKISETCITSFNADCLKKYFYYYKCDVLNIVNFFIEKKMEIFSKFQ